MKKVVSLFLTLAIMLALTSCSLFEESAYHFDSLDEYIKKRVGYSSYELDEPAHFLPSQESKAFLRDYDYVYGEFHSYEEGVFVYPHAKPSMSLLALRYEADIYEEAKSFMLKNIPAYNDFRYIYGDYIFYENANFTEKKDSRYFPRWFTMACYNDTKQELVFIGFYDSVGMDQKYYDDPQGNWVSFIDTYYGEYYDFSE